MKNCKECKNYMYLWDNDKFCHYCREYPNFKVMGSLEGIQINPNCSKYVARVQNKLRGLSLKEKTLARAGGTWQDQKKRAEEARLAMKKKEEELKNKHLCCGCLKPIPANRKFCEDCTPMNVKRRRELSKIRYDKKKGN